MSHTKAFDKYDNRTVLKLADILFRHGFKGEIVGGVWKGKNESHDLDLICRERDLRSNRAIIGKYRNACPDIPIELYVVEPKYYKGLCKALRATRWQAIQGRLMKGLHFCKVSL
jgi:hypothetical protein